MRGVHCEQHGKSPLASLSQESLIMETARELRTKEAHVTLDGVAHVVPAGRTVVSKLKEELGVDPTASLFLKEHGKRRLLADHRVIVVKSGMEFEAIPVGGVS